MLGNAIRFMGGGVLLLVAAAAPMSAQIVNGGFETPLTTDHDVYTTGSSFTGWTVVGDPGNVWLTNNAASGLGQAHSGSQWLDLTGTSHTATGVQQTFATTAGTEYDLSFWVGNTNEFNTTKSSVLLFLNSTLGTSYTNSGLDGTTSVWQQFTQTFTANGPMTTMTFINGDGINDGINQLDDVSVSVHSTTTTPEPSSMALLGTGLVGLVPMIRRRWNAA